MSVLTDQVEAQGEKIRDLESSLEGHRQKLASTEEMLQQVTDSHVAFTVRCLAKVSSAVSEKKDGAPDQVAHSGLH